ncbi:MAG: glycosyltransferase family 2 protein [Dysgonomonas sp.]
MNYPKISIVTPVYNSVDFLEETILSVISQNYPNLEYIIIDGGSTDGSLDIIRKYEDKLSYWISEPDNGMYDAIQKGFDRATGDIMTWLNSDDMHLPKSLWNVAQIFCDIPNIEWIMGIPIRYNQDGLCVEVIDKDCCLWSRLRFVVGDNKYIQQESCFWKRDLWNKAGKHINSTYKLAGDFELWTRFFEYSKLYTINTALSGFRVHENQLSKSIDEYHKEMDNIYSSFYKKVTVKEKFIRFLFKGKDDIHNRILDHLWKLLSNSLLYKAPRMIKYDFDTNKWS